MSALGRLAAAMNDAFGGSFWAALFLVAVAPLAVAGDFEIHASRIGYNLLWPTKRCCAFDLNIVEDGTATLTVKRSEGSDPTTETRAFTISHDDLLVLRKLVDANQFFSLPKDIGDWPVDGDEQRILIRIGDRSHQVHFAEWSSDASPELTRAFNVWRGIKATFKIQGENVERQ